MMPCVPPPRGLRWVLAFVPVVVLLAASHAIAEPVLLDGVAASVGRQVITLSEVETEARLLLVQRGGAQGLTASIDDALRAKVLEYLIVQEALVREAGRRGGFLIPERDIDRGLAMQKAKLGSLENYNRLLSEAQIDDERMRGIARRDLTVAALLNKALPRDDVAPAEIDTYLEKYPDFLAGAPNENRRNKAKEVVAGTKKQQAFAQLTDALLAAVEVRRIAAWAAPR